MSFSNLPSLSWSKSRVEQFKTCQRQYYFNYYGYWGGWYKNAEARTKKNYYLKRLVSYEAMTGLIIHDVIARYIRLYFNGMADVVTPDTIIDDDFEQFKKNSIDKLYIDNKAQALLDYHYTKIWDEKRFKAEKIKVKKQFKYFLKVFQDMLDCGLKKENILTIDDAENDFLQELIGDKLAKIYMVRDFAFTIGDDAYIIDWKSGKKESNDFQMLCYGIITALKHKMLYPKIINITVFLDVKETNVTKFSLESYTNLVNQISKDLTLFSKHDTMKEKDFAVTTNQYICENCKFKEICDRK